MDVIPDSEYLDQLDAYKAKFSTGLLKQITKQVGLDTVDERVYKIISIMMEDKLSQIVQEVKAMQQQSLPNKEHISVHQLLQLVGRDQSDGRTE
jgi:galactitol-specific phosphotransferase system IIC component